MLNILHGMHTGGLTPDGHARLDRAEPDMSTGPRFEELLIKFEKTDNSSNPNRRLLRIYAITASWLYEIDDILFVGS